MPKLRTIVSKYTPKSIKYVKCGVLSGFHQLRRPIHAYRHRIRPKILQTSIPKSGTHLLNQVLELSGYWLYKNQPFNPYVDTGYEPSALRPHLTKLFPGEYLIEHLTWQQGIEGILAEENVKTLFIYRDPRATAISYSHFIAKKNISHPHHPFYKQLDSLEARIDATLNGVGIDEPIGGIKAVPWGELYDRFLPWKKSPEVCSVSFEELIGSKGGGSDEKQLEKIVEILSNLGFLNAETLAPVIASEVFNPRVPTFRKGRCDSWRDEISSETADMLTQEFARQLQDWGYNEY